MNALNRLREIFLHYIPYPITSNASNSFRNLQSFEISFTCLFGAKKAGVVDAY
ncbi:MAG: hypothetical protein V4539_03060 [Bacteroidota bacterium]